MEEVLPVLRSRADIDFTLLQATLSGQRMTTDDLPHRSLNDQLVAALAIEHGETVRYLTPYDLQQRGQHMIRPSVLTANPRQRCREALVEFESLPG